MLFVGDREVNQFFDLRYFLVMLVSFKGSIFMLT